jgi:hypothetical protein
MVQRGYDGSLPLLQQTPLRWGELLPAAAVVTALGALWVL